MPSYLHEILREELPVAVSLRSNGYRAEMPGTGFIIGGDTAQEAQARFLNGVQFAMRGIGDRQVLRYHTTAEQRAQHAAQIRLGEHLGTQSIDITILGMPEKHTYEFYLVDPIPNL